MKDPTGYNIVFRKVTRMFLVKTENHEMAINAVADLVNGVTPDIEVAEDREFGDSPNYEIDSPDQYYGDEWEANRQRIFEEK